MHDLAVTVVVAEHRIKRVLQYADTIVHVGAGGVVTNGDPAEVMRTADVAPPVVELGRWGEAEALLTKAQAEFTAAMHTPAWHPDLGLAELRVAQGRLADAEELLLGKDQLLEALLPMARLQRSQKTSQKARQKSSANPQNSP